ncbi:hypothetical protein BAE44_0004426 [Dichanthelium oligosanthes]|uniref:GDSL esterase/lipase n=1 Tax=Dichanthelium oligosanthes TaxID=888268 RepID=A0A1E5WB21_9POAL|nr:hypothetical protein BAE44_0004426 [Dichanthelium oligosanthes]
MACCGYGGPPYNYNHFKACMSAEMQLCDVGARFISWDGVHFTEAANAIVAAKVLTGNYSTPRVTMGFASLSRGNGTDRAWEKKKNAKGNTVLLLVLVGVVVQLCSPAPPVAAAAARKLAGQQAESGSGAD